ncbi:MAG TPA: fumarylacetoacetate hydrolase family protein [Patescibacteria group bacterium]|nr:fumarylacetoacetate hydrolase family protein [Patescibacteria group bacterium]
MKIVSFQDRGPRTGTVIGDMVLDINAAQPFLPRNIEEILLRGLLPEVQNLVDNASELDRSHFKPVAEVALYPPVPRPSKIICLGLNYAGHAREQNREPPPHPILFSKAPSALTGPFDDIVVRPGIDNIDAEAELAVVIGREGTMIPVEEAENYIAGYTVFNDVSARRVQREDRQWFRGKSFDTFAPCGPWLVTPDEIGNPQALAISQVINGLDMQQSNTAEMIFPIAEIVSFISNGLTLMPGDIIATGTPAGVGVFRDPPLFLQDGDVVEIEIERIGRLRNRVRFMS